MAEKMTIIYVEPTTNEEQKIRNVINRRIARCPHCGKESPVDPKHVGRNWPKYVDPLREAAEKANPPTPEEVVAEEALKLRQQEFEAAQQDQVVLERKIAEGTGRTLSTSPGQPVRLARNKKLMEEADELRAVVAKRLRSAEEALKAARSKNGKLQTARMFRVNQWRENRERELIEKAKAKAARESGNGKSALSKRLKEVLQG